MTYLPTDLPSLDRLKLHDYIHNDYRTFKPGAFGTYMIAVSSEADLGLINR